MPITANARNAAENDPPRNAIRTISRVGAGARSTTNLPAALFLRTSMKRIRYSKYTGSPADELEMESLLEALADYLLDSGFRSSLSRFQELEDEQTLDNLREALRRALEHGDLFDPAGQERIDRMVRDGQIEDLIEQLIERMEQENYLSFDQPLQANRPTGVGSKTGAAETQARFQVTDKGLDFLGYK